MPECITQVAGVLWMEICCMTIMVFSVKEELAGSAEISEERVSPVCGECPNRLFYGSGRSR